MPDRQDFDPVTLIDDLEVHEIPHTPEKHATNRWHGLHGTTDEFRSFLQQQDQTIDVLVQRPRRLVAMFEPPVPGLR
jgi:hypothetical protein